MNKRILLLIAILSITFILYVEGAKRGGKKELENKESDEQSEESKEIEEQEQEGEMEEKQPERKMVEEAKGILGDEFLDMALKLVADIFVKYKCLIILLIEFISFLLTVIF